MRRVVLALITLVGVVLAGAGIWFSTDLRPAAYGWTAYSPLSSESYPIVVGPPTWAILLIAAGSLVVGATLTLLVVSARTRS